MVVTGENTFWLLESQTHRYVDLSLADFLQPLGVQHFYDAFGLNAEISIRTAALEAFCRVSMQKAGFVAQSILMG